MPPPTRWAWWPASRSRLQTASTSSGISFGSIIGPGRLLRRRLRIRLENVQGLGGRGLLGFLLRLAPGPPVLGRPQVDGNLEGLVVVRPLLGDDRIGGGQLQA